MFHVAKTAVILLTAKKISNVQRNGNETVDLEIGVVWVEEDVSYPIEI